MRDMRDYVMVLYFDSGFLFLQRTEAPAPGDPIEIRTQSWPLYRCIFPSYGPLRLSGR